MSRLRLVAWALGLAALESTAACNLLFSVDGYAGPTARDAAVDVTTPRDSAASGDTSSETSPPSEAAPSLDGGFSCPDSALLCDDFARTTVAGGPWDMVTTGGGTLTIVPNAPTGNALDCIVQAGANVQITDVSKAYTAMTVSRMTYEFGFDLVSGIGVQPATLNFYNQSDSVTSTTLLYLNQPGAGELSLNIGEVVCGKAADAACGGFMETTGIPFTQNAWHTVSWTIDFTSSPAQYTLTLDGTTITATSPSFIESGWLTMISAGATYTDQDHPDIDLRIDRVIVTAR